MKYNLKEWKGREIVIGPIQKNQIGLLFGILRGEGYVWQGGEELGLESHVTYEYIHLNEFSPQTVTQGFQPEEGWEVVSFETFMEHNTEKAYRIKTWEELLGTENTTLEYGGDIKHQTDTNFSYFTNGMKNLCGKSISTDFHEKVIRENWYMYENSHLYVHPWMVTDKPLNMKEKEIVGYKLIKEYPGRNVGDTAGYVPVVSERSFFWEKDGKGIPKDFQPDVNPLWFEPIYKEEKTEVEISVGNPKKEVRIFSSGHYQYEGDSKKRNIKDLKIFKGVFIMSRAGNRDALGHDFTIKSVWVGCEKGTLITVEDIDKILDIYNKEFKQ